MSIQKIYGLGLSALMLLLCRQSLALPAQFLLLGHHAAAPGAKTETEESWYGIFPAKNGKSEISPLKVKIKYEELEDLGTMQNITIASGQIPLFLVKNLAGKTPSSIPSSFSSTFTLPEEKFKNSKVLFPGQSIALQASNLSCRLIAQGKITDSSKQEGTFPSAKNYRLKLSCNSQEQVLLDIAQTNASIPSLIWAGDIDQDGRIDLLIEGLGHYNGTSHKLFLSSAAKTGELVQKVGEIEDLAP